MPYTDQLKRIAALKEEYPQNIALQCFDPAYFATLTPAGQARLMACLNSGLENPDSEMGCYACQPADYDDFRPFFAQVLARYHKVNRNACHVNSWSLAQVAGLPSTGALDLAALGLTALSMRVRVGRNLADFPLPGAMTREDRVALETRMMPVFDGLMADADYGGAYHSLTPGHPMQIDLATYQTLVTQHIMFKDMSTDSYLRAAGIAADWPYGRGCYVSQDRGFIIWVGEEDHLRFMCLQRGTVLNHVFDRLKAALDKLAEFADLRFAMSPEYGVVTSCPTNAGTGMRASVHISLPCLTSGGTDRKATEVCRSLGLSLRGIGGEHTPIGADGTVDVSPSARFCITEAEIMVRLYQGVAALQKEEAKARALLANSPAAHGTHRAD